MAWENHDMGEPWHGRTTAWENHDGGQPRHGRNTTGEESILSDVKIAMSACFLMPICLGVEPELDLVGWDKGPDREGKVDSQG